MRESCGSKYVASGSEGIEMCAHIRDVFILWLHCALVLDVFSPSECLSVSNEYLALYSDGGEVVSRQLRKKKDMLISYINA